MTGLILKAHLVGAFSLTGLCAVAGVWSAIYWRRGRQPSKPLEVLYWLCFVVVYLQVAAGAALYGRGLRPADATHVLYGITPAVIVIVLMSSKKSIEARRAAVMTVALLAFAGMGVRGIMTGFG